MTDISNLSDTVKPKSNQLNADDLISGPITVTITGVKKTSDPKQPTQIIISGGFQPFLPCLTMRRVLIAAWGIDGRKYIGRSMTLFRDPTVPFGDDIPGGVRISHLSDIDAASMKEYGATFSDGVWTLKLTKTRGKKAPHKIRPIQSDAPASQSPFWSQDKFATKLAEFTPRLKSGERTVQQAIDWFTAKAQLTTAQIAEIEAAAVQNAEEF